MPRVLSRRGNRDIPADAVYVGHPTRWGEKMKARLAFVTVMLAFMAFTVGYRYGVDTGLYAVSAQYEQRLQYLESQFPKLQQQTFANIDSIQMVADQYTNLNHSLADAHRNLSIYSGIVEDVREVVVRGRGQIVPVQYRR